MMATLREFGELAALARCGKDEPDHADPQDQRRQRLPGDDPAIGSMLQPGVGDRTPHEVRVMEGRVHRHDVADELPVGVVVGDVAEGDQREEAGDRDHEGDAGKPDYSHGRRRIKTSPADSPASWWRP